jgi:flagellar FliL protein
VAKAEVAEAEAGAEAPAGGKKKLLIIVGAAVLLLGVAGAAAFFLVGGDDAADAGQDAAAQVPQGDPVYHSFTPPFVANLAPGGPAGMLQIAVEVMTRTPGVTAVLKANDPMLRHHLLNLFEAQKADELLTVKGKEALQAAIHELLNAQLAELEGPGEIQGVYFTQFVMQ